MLREFYVIICYTPRFQDMYDENSWLFWLYARESWNRYVDENDEDGDADADENDHEDADEHWYED